MFFFQAEDGIRDKLVTGVQTCALPICASADVPGVRTSGARAGAGAGVDDGRRVVATGAARGGARPEFVRRAPAPGSGRVWARGSSGAAWSVRGGDRAGRGGGRGLMPAGAAPQVFATPPSGLWAVVPTTCQAGSAGRRNPSGAGVLGGAFRKWDSAQATAGEAEPRGTSPLASPPTLGPG